MNISINNPVTKTLCTDSYEGKVVTSIVETLFCCKHYWPHHDFFCPVYVFMYAICIYMYIYIYIYVYSHKQYFGDRWLHIEIIFVYLLWKYLSFCFVGYKWLCHKNDSKLWGLIKYIFIISFSSPICDIIHEIFHSWIFLYCPLPGFSPLISWIKERQPH